MALNLVSPGINIREVDLTIGRIDGIGDQVGAFCGPFQKGPVGQAVLIETEADLLRVFGQPLQKDSQNEYWLSASSFLSYGGVLRVVRADSTSLVNANSGGLNDLKIDSNEDYENNNITDTTWEFAAKTPGTWGTGLKVCAIDNFADQIISGVGTTSISVTNDVTITTVTGDIAATTDTVTGINTSLIQVDDTIRNSNFTAGAQVSVVSVGASTITLNATSDNSSPLTGESFQVERSQTTVSATDLQVGYALTQTTTATVPNNDGTTTSFSGFIRGIITGIGKDELYVKVTDRVETSTGKSTSIVYKNPGQGENAFSFSSTDAVNVVGTSGTVRTGYAAAPGGVSDWYDNQTLGLSNSTVYWKSIAPKPGTSEYCSERSSADDQVHIAVIDDSGKISGTASNILEKYVFLSKASDAKVSPTQPTYYKSFLADNSTNIYAGYQAPSIISSLTAGTNAQEFTLASTGPWGSEAQGVKFNLLGNTSYDLKDGFDYGADGSMAASIANVVSGYNIFTNPAEYSVDYIIQGPSGGSDIYSSQAKAGALLAIASERKDCIACISPHRADIVNQTNTQTQTDKIIEFFEPLSSTSYGVFDSGYKYTLDRFNNKFVYLPLNADIAGLMARTSNDDYPWFSPAGANRGAINNAIKLAFNPSKAQRDLLYTKRINPVIASSGQGILLFGDKTALGYASAFDRINVRKLFLTLEKQIEGAARSQLFEFNDEITRSNFINIVEPYLRDVKGKRGITEFLLVCDESNNTPEVIDANQFKADIFIKPNRSINFIGLTFVATRTGISFSEVVGNV